MPKITIFEDEVQLSTALNLHRFMNASLQMIAHQMAAPELSDVVLDYQPPGLSEAQVEMYIKLQQSFLNVCDAINERGQRAESLVNLQREFMKDYLAFSQATGRASAAFIMEGQQPGDLRPALIPQQDPHEFLNDLADIFGLSHHPKCSLNTFDHKYMVHERKAKFGKAHDEGRNALLPIAVKRSGHKTIDGCVGSHLSPEKLDDQNRFKWDAADKARAGLRDDDQIDTYKQQEFVSAGVRPPERLMLQMKIFEYDQVQGAANKLNKDAADLMSHSVNRVTIPIAPKLAEGNGKPVNQEYDITSIVCHHCSSSASGHYVSLRFEDDKVIVCDDDIVLELNEYARFHGRKPYADWRDFCAQEKLTGYLVPVRKPSNT